MRNMSRVLLFLGTLLFVSAHSVLGDPIVLLLPITTTVTLSGGVVTTGTGNANYMLILYRATTIVSRVPTSVRLAELRRRHEDHRFAIKQRILEAHAYELILNGGADRLALLQGRYQASAISTAHI